MRVMSSAYSAELFLVETGFARLQNLSKLQQHSVKHRELVSTQVAPTT